MASYLAIPLLVLVLAASALVPCISSTSALSFPDLTALTILGVDVSHFRSVLVPVLPSVKVPSFLSVEAWQEGNSRQDLHPYPGQGCRLRSDGVEEGVRNRPLDTIHTSVQLGNLRVKFSM